MTSPRICLRVMELKHLKPSIYDVGLAPIRTQTNLHSPSLRKMDQTILHTSLLSPHQALLKYPVAFRVESRGRPPSPSAPIYSDGRTLRSIIYGPATLELATKHLLESESSTPFVSVLWIWDRALAQAEKLSARGDHSIRIFIIDLKLLHAEQRVYDAFALAKRLGFREKGEMRPTTEEHKGELLLHCSTPQHFCPVLASIPAGMPTIYYDSTASSSGIIRLPIEYFELLSHRLSNRSRGGVRRSMLNGIISETKMIPDEETWLDERSAKLLQDVLEDDLLEQCAALDTREVLRAMTMDVSDYLGLMRVIRLPESYYVPEKRVGGEQRRGVRQSFMMEG